MTTASKITLVRVAMIPAYMVTMYLSGGSAGLWMLISLAIFIVASLTDFIDGYIARKYKQVSDFGKFLDPLADKLLTIACMCMMCEWGMMPAWALMIVLTREFAVTGLRLVAVQNGTVIAAGDAAGAGDDQQGGQVTDEHGQHVLQAQRDRLAQRHFAVQLKCLLGQIFGLFHKGKTSLSLNNRLAVYHLIGKM